MRLMRYKYSVTYTPSKNLIIPDSLCRGPLKTKIIRKEQENDFVCKKLKEFSITSWPGKAEFPVELLPYYQYRYDISYAERFVFKGTRIIIPQSLQLKVLGFIHTGRLGIVKCRERAKSSVWWIGLSTQIDNLVTHCPQCVEYRENHKETFYKDKTVRRPWQKLVLDFCKCT
nr:unnamed protein product [Callosobruchus analis]